MKYFLVTFHQAYTTPQFMSIVVEGDPADFVLANARKGTMVSILCVHEISKEHYEKFKKKTRFEWFNRKLVK